LRGATFEHREPVLEHFDPREHDQLLLARRCRQLALTQDVGAARLPHGEAVLEHLLDGLVDGELRANECQLLACFGQAEPGERDLG